MRKLHRIIDSLPLDSYVHEALAFGFTRRKSDAHENMHECGCRSNGAWQSLRAAGAGKQSEVYLRQSQQEVPVLSDTKIASQRELESTGQGRAGYGGDHRLRHALTQRHNLVEESPVVGRVLGPLATGRPEGLRDLNKRWDIEVTIEITRCATGDDDHANGGIACQTFQSFGKNVPHLGVEVDALCAAQRHDRDSIGYGCRENVGVHRVLLSCHGLGWLEDRQTNRLLADLVAKQAWIGPFLSAGLRCSKRLPPESDSRSPAAAPT